MQPRQTEPSTRDAMKRRKRSTSSHASSANSSAAGKRVSFGSVQLREYNRIAGDHPEVKEGPSLSLGWDFVEQKPQSIDNFEENRDRSVQLMPLTGQTRTFILSFVFDISPQDIKRSENIAMRVTSQRLETSKIYSKGQAGKAFLKAGKFAHEISAPGVLSNKDSRSSCVIEDPLPRQSKDVYRMSFLRNAARKSLGVYKRFERR